MSTVNNKRGNYVGPIIIIILLTGVLAGGVMLHFFNRNLNNAIKQSEQQLIQLQQEIKSFQNLRSGKQVIKNEHKRLVGFIPSRENQEEFIWELGKLAQENNLKIGKCVFDSKLLTLKNLPKYQAVQCEVTLSGSYQNLLAFIDSLPRIARLVLVSKLNLKMIAKVNNSEPPQFEVLLTLDLIASATQVAFSQQSSANSVSSAQVPPTSEKAPTFKKAQPTKKAPPFKPTPPSPTAKKPPASIPATDPTTGDGSPLEVKNPPIINPG